jgi:hypothetical protein
MSKDTETMDKAIQEMKDTHKAGKADASDTFEGVKAVCLRCIALELARIAAALEGLPNKRELLAGILQAGDWACPESSVLVEECRSKADELISACKEPP